MTRGHYRARPNMPGPAGGLSRRALLKGAAVTGFGAAPGALALRPAANAAADTPTSAQASQWQSFDRAVEAAMSTFGMVGAAVAVVNRAGVLHERTFGVRNLASSAPVTQKTLFRVGSTTKSMTALLVATFVDEGLLDWDRPVVKVWPAFRAPSAALTDALRVRDLMGMDTGLGEGAIALHYDQPTAIQLMQALGALPVRTAPYTEWHYNNVVYAAAGYLPLLAKGAPVEGLQSAYAQMMKERVFGPNGMDGARIGNDPRPFTNDYATGYAVDFVAGTAAVNWIPIGCIAPAGAVLATVEDMAAYLRLQLARGVTQTGTRIVSARNLEECWRPHIAVPPSPLDGPDIDSARYGMGWIDYTYKGGRRLMWHTGFWDGFGAFVGFLPEEDLGLVVITNMSVGSSNYFHKYVLNLLLSSSFGLNREMNEKIVAGYQDAARSLANAASQSVAVDAGSIAPFLGYYERGYRLAYDPAGALRLYLSAAADRVLGMGNGSYVMASGQSAGTVIRFARDKMGIPRMELEGFETVRWLSGPS